MRLIPIEAGFFRLDGGAMFGVVPKVLWQRSNPADSCNRIELAMRCLLIEDGDRLVLIDTGWGDKQSEKFFGYFAPWGDASLDKSLRKAGFSRADITDVFLTHLHFDHCGGAIRWNADRTACEPAFKNARFWSNADHWCWATQPNAREKASFLKENISPIQESGQLEFVTLPESGFLSASPLGFDILFVDGHTDKQMIPHIRYQGQTLVYAADLLPTTGHIPLPYVMGYDTRPLLTLREKAQFLNRAAEAGYLVFFEHDAHTQVCMLKQTEKGVRLDKTYTFEEVFG